MNNQPKEIIKYILGFIPGHILVILTRVSKEWLDLIENHILRLEIVPSIEQCIMTKNYFYGRRYLSKRLDIHQQYLITLVNDKVFVRHFKISQTYVNINDMLIYYSINGYIEVVKLLLEKGADIHYNDDCALRWSASNGHTAVVKLLLEKGADIHASNDYVLKYSKGAVHDYLNKLIES